MIPIQKSMKFTNFTQASATLQVFVGPGRLVGYIIASTTSGTIKAEDRNGAGASLGTVHGTLTPAAGNSVNCFNAGVVNGLLLTIGGTINATVVWHDE